MLNAKNLLSCPCCNGTSLLKKKQENQEILYQVQCKECGLSSMWCNSALLAVKKWNNRNPVEQSLSQMLQSLEEFEYLARTRGNVDYYIGMENAVNSDIQILIQNTGVSLPTYFYSDNTTEKTPYISFKSGSYEPKI